MQHQDSFTEVFLTSFWWTRTSEKGHLCSGLAAPGTARPLAPMLSMIHWCFAPTKWIKSGRKTYKNNRKLEFGPVWLIFSGNPEQKMATELHIRLVHLIHEAVAQVDWRENISCLANSKVCSNHTQWLTCSQAWWQDLLDSVCKVSELYTWSWRSQASKALFSPARC